MGYLRVDLVFKLYASTVHPLLVKSSLLGDEQHHLWFSFYSMFYRIDRCVS